jgi:hypothetical protein
MDFPSFFYISAPSWQAWLAPLAIIISATAGVITTIVSIGSSREISRKNAVMSYINSSMHDSWYAKGMRIITEMHSDPEEEIKRYADSNYKERTTDKKEKAEYIRHTLNHFEHLSAGIKEGIFDEQLAFQIKKGVVKNTWKQTREFIYLRREHLGSNTLYENFERLASAWQNERFMCNHHVSWWKKWRYKK